MGGPEARATEHRLLCGIQAPRALLSGPEGSPEQAGGLLERRVAARRHGGTAAVSPALFGRAAVLVEEEDGALVAAAVAVVGRAEDGDDVLVVAPGVPLHGELMGAPAG